MTPPGTRRRCWSASRTRSTSSPTHRWSRSASRRCSRVTPRSPTRSSSSPTWVISPPWITRRRRAAPSPRREARKRGACKLRRRRRASAVATVVAQCRAGDGEKAPDVLVGVGEREVELRRHRIQEDPAAEETQQKGAGARPVRVERGTVVDDLVIGEHDRRERSIALDLRGESLLHEHRDQPGAQRFAELEEVPVRPRTAKLGQGGEGRRRRDGVASDARREPNVAVLTESILADEIEDVGAAGDHANRIAATERLAEGGQVRAHAVVLLSAAVRQAEARHGLVEDQEHPELGGELAQTREEPGLGRRAAMQWL